MRLLLAVGFDSDIRAELFRVSSDELYVQCLVYIVSTVIRTADRSSGSRLSASQRRHESEIINQGSSVT